MTGPFDAAIAVADAVLYEGYLLYPYRASADKNRMRFQFGVLVPPDAIEATGEAPTSRTELLCEPGDGATLTVRLRFLHVRTRTVEQVHGDGYAAVDSLAAGDTVHVPWDEAVERDVSATVALDTVLGGEVTIPFDVEAAGETEPLVHDGVTIGRLVRACAPLTGVLRISASRLDGPYPAVHLRVLVENTTAPVPGPLTRDVAMRRAFAGAHTLLALSDGGFLSLTEPPEWAASAARTCVNERTWPVLVARPGGGTVALSSPIILSDYPEIAPESPGSMFDGTEIDEILTLRTMTLTEAEKREVRATDERAAALLDRVDAMPPELLDRLHGTIRYLRQVTGSGAADGGAGAVPEVPWWDPAADASVDPETDRVVIAGVEVGKGSRVRLAPRAGGTDAQDMFLDGLAATVQAVIRDVDGDVHVAVTVDDDPATELQLAQGRFRYFDPTEIEPVPDPDRVVAAGPVPDRAPVGDPAVAP